MGKRRRQQIETNHGEDPKQGRIRAWLGKKKQQVTDTVDSALDKVTAINMEKHYKRWMEGSYCHTPKLIKWDDPQISLEVKLCDPRNLRLIKKGRHRDEFFSICTDEEIDIYLHGVPPEYKDYTCLEDPHILRDLVHGVKEQYREAKKRRKETFSEEELDALDSLLDGDEEDENEP